MNISLIRSAFFILVLVAVSHQLTAQQNHFIYLQTENRQPFYIKMDKKLISSSVSGYLIIPKLQDGEYTLIVGFPKNEFTEQIINCRVNKKDAGYILKNFGDKGWGLFNLQTMEVVMSGTKPKENAVAAVVNKNDDFSTTLSNVVKDPSIAKKEEVVTTAPAEPVKQPETVPVKLKEEPAVTTPVTHIEKLLSSTNASGTELIFADVVNGIPDTVRVFIPVEKTTNEIPAEKKEKPEAIKKDQIAEPKTENKLAEFKAEANAGIKTEIKNEGAAEKAPKFIDIALPNPNARPDTAAKQLASTIAVEKKADAVIPVPEKPNENPAKSVMMNSDCKALAGDDDFLKLRKKMAAEDNDDDMLGAARKIFKTKCFTTEQVKNLSVLFLKDEGKYKFFDLAYPFVSDSHNFGSLEVQLKDAYYIDRFKVMLRH